MILRGPLIKKTRMCAGVWVSCLSPAPLPSSSLLSCHPSCCCGDCLGATDTSMSCWAALMLIGPDGESFVPVCSPKAAASHITTWEGKCPSLTLSHTHAHTHIFILTFEGLSFEVLAALGLTYVFLCSIFALIRELNCGHNE